MPRLPSRALCRVADRGRHRRYPPDRFPALAALRDWSLIAKGLFAHGFVRYVGEPVAAVFADDPDLAEDAAELVALDIEELPTILQADERPGESQPGLFDGAAVAAQGIRRRTPPSHADAAVEAGRFRSGRHTRGLAGNPRLVIARDLQCRPLRAGARPRRRRRSDWHRSQQSPYALDAGLRRVHLSSKGMSRAASAFAAISSTRKTIRSARPATGACSGRSTGSRTAASISSQPIIRAQQQHHVRAALDRDGRSSSRSKTRYFTIRALTPDHARTADLDLAAASAAGAHRIPAIAPMRMTVIHTDAVRHLSARMHSASTTAKSASPMAARTASTTGWAPLLRALQS